jgi:hypothetical protein
VKKNKTKEGDRDCEMMGSTLDRLLREGLSKKVTFGHRPEGHEGLSPGHNCGWEV